MGIPALFRWLTQKYPKVTSSVVEELPREVGGLEIPVDFSKPNPNGFEMDNLYLDMNGIIHPCCHPEDKPAPKNEDEMYLEIFKYIDRIISMVRPRKVLYMAIDGVAPRAKMNQQRSRRFRAALDAQEKIQSEEKAKQEYEKDHGKLPEKIDQEHFDSNCITPGTPFMSTLATALKYYIAERLNSSPGWKNLKVIISDASIPGEGEHKIMDFIRRQRNSPHHDPNTQHVLYGLDADLIMLALATHEPHFKILREDVFFQDRDNKGCFVCGQVGHQANQCTGKAKSKSGEFDEIGVNSFVKPYVFLHVNILREYLEIELKSIDLPFAWNFERAIDDFVFLCFFVGNDFLPHLPSLEIREGAIDKLIDIWKQNLVTFGGYITDSGEIDLSRVAILLKDLGQIENKDEIFKKRRGDEERRRANKKRRDDQQFHQEKREEIRLANTKPAIVETMGSIPMYGVKGISKEDRRIINQETVLAKKEGVVWGGPDKKLKANKNAALLLKLQMLTEKSVMEETTATTLPVKRKADEILERIDEVEEEVLEEGGDVKITEQSIELITKTENVEVAVDEEDEDEEDVPEIPIELAHIAPDIITPVVKDENEPEDNVRLWEQGWKKRYYKNKFQVDENDMEFRKTLIKSYVEGFCWVLKYYYQGCPSWQWYFPYHYSPFASDFDCMADMCIEFTLGKPFKPYEQLMGVLPAASRQHIPQTFHELMCNTDSPILDFYPEKFPVDLNGKKYAWQGVALLPFIDEKRLLDAMQTCYGGLSEEEIQRNEKGNEVLWVGQYHPTFDKLCVLYAKKDDSIMELDPELTDHLTGSVSRDPEISIPGCSFYSPLVKMGLPDIEENQSISAVYHMPIYPENYSFKAFLLSSVRMPRRILGSEDYYFIKMGGYNRGGRGRGGMRMNIESSGRMIRHAVQNNHQCETSNSYQCRQESKGSILSNEGRYSQHDEFGRDRPSYSGGYQPRGVSTNNGGYGTENSRYQTSTQYSGGYRPQSYQPSPYQSGNQQYPNSRGGYQQQSQQQLPGSRGRGGYQQQSEYSGRQQQNIAYSYPINGNQQFSPQRPPINLAWSRNVSQGQHRQIGRGGRQ